MARRGVDDVDVWCDPENPRKIRYDDILDAAKLIRPFIQHTIMIASHNQKQFSMALHYKLELMQPSGSFKERGALCALLRLPLDTRKIGIVVGSLGNAAIAMCHIAAKNDIPVVVVVPTTVPISTLHRCHTLGAKVIVNGNSLTDAQKYARIYARERGLTFINGRDHPNVLAGYGSIALEILRDLPQVEAILVPIGTGGLAAAIAAVVKHDKPDCQIYGFQAEAAPAFYKYLETECDTTMLPLGKTLADNIAVSQVGANAFPNIQPNLDKLLLVKEECIARAVLHMKDCQRIMIEGAAACPVAALLANQIPELKGKTVVCILTGGNVDNWRFTRGLFSGLSAEGRLIKFRVLLRDTTLDVTRLLRLLAASGYTILDQMQDHRWMDNDEHKMEIMLTCQTYGLSHALELKRLVERSYPGLVVFETEPFNNKRTCPCHVFKKTPCV